MAQYTIVTTPEQEVGLDYAFDSRINKEQTKDQFLQDKINHAVLNPMIVVQHDAVTVALDRSIKSIPAANEEKAALEIQAVIVSNGGTLIPVGPPADPLASVFVPTIPT